MRETEMGREMEVKFWNNSVRFMVMMIMVGYILMKIGPNHPFLDDQQTFGHPNLQNDQSEND